MPRKSKASQLYKEGRFNVANIIQDADGSQTISCDGVLAPRPYSFRARNFLTPEEEILEDEDVELEADASEQC